MSWRQNSSITHRGDYLRHKITHLSPVDGHDEEWSCDFPDPKKASVTIHWSLSLSQISNLQLLQNYIMALQQAGDNFRITSTKNCCAHLLTKVCRSDSTCCWFHSIYLCSLDIFYPPPTVQFKQTNQKTRDYFIVQQQQTKKRETMDLIRQVQWNGISYLCFLLLRCKTMYPPLDGSKHTDTNLRAYRLGSEWIILHTAAMTNIY